MMRVILLEKLGDLGDIGQEIYVKSGYARNFLIPMGKVVSATKKNIEFFQSRRAFLENDLVKRKHEAEVIISKIKALGSVVIFAKSGMVGKLFGSIGKREIVDALKNIGIDISKNHIHLPCKKIRSLGDYDINIRIFHGIYSNLKVCVTSAEIHR